MNRALWHSGKQLPNIPLHPSQWDNSQPFGELNGVLAGIPGPFSYPVFGNRTALFLQQQVVSNGDTLSWLRCNFYERLRSAEDLINATAMYNLLMQHNPNHVDGSNSPEGALRTPTLVTLAVTIFPSMYDAPDGIVPLPEQDERPIGDHIVLPIGFKDGYLYFRHNWGPKWGVEGIGRFSVEYLQRFQREAWSKRFLAGPRPEGQSLGGIYLVPEGDLGSSGERIIGLLRHPWDRDSDSRFFMLRESGRLHRAGRVDLLGRWLTSIGDGSVWLQLVAILHDVEGGPFIAGWMDIRGTASGGMVEELFVWPPYRELGIGTTLAGQGLLYAMTNPTWPRDCWEWHTLEADVAVLERSQRKPHVPSWLRTVHSNSHHVPQEVGKRQILDWLRLISEAQEKWR